MVAAVARYLPMNGCGPAKVFRYAYEAYSEEAAEAEEKDNDVVGGAAATRAEDGQGCASER